MFRVPVYKEETVSCKNCKSLVYISDAQEVKTSGLGYRSVYYCQAHKVNYDKVYVSYDYKEFFYKELCVNEKGEPFGYKKIKK